MNMQRDPHPPTPAILGFSARRGQGHIVIAWRRSKLLMVQGSQKNLPAFKPVAKISYYL